GRHQPPVGAATKDNHLPEVRPELPAPRLRQGHHRRRRAGQLELPGRVHLADDVDEPRGTLGEVGSDADAGDGRLVTSVDLLLGLAEAEPLDVNAADTWQVDGAGRSDRHLKLATTKVST